MQKRLIPSLRWLVFFLALISEMIPSIAKAGHFSIFGGAALGKIYNNSIQGPGFLVRELGYTGGIFYEFNIMTWKLIQPTFGDTLHHVTIEFGGDFTKRRFSYTSAGNTVQVGLGSVEVPVSIRFWYSRFFSFAFGSYLALPLGNISSDSGSGIIEVPRTSRIEIGGFAGLRFILNNPSVNSRYMRPVFFRIFSEIRYQIAFTQMHINDLDMSYNDLKILIGIRFGGIPYGHD